VLLLGRTVPCRACAGAGRTPGAAAPVCRGPAAGASAGPAGGGPAGAAVEHEYDGTGCVTRVTHTVFNEAGRVLAVAEQAAGTAGGGGVTSYWCSCDAGGDDGRSGDAAGGAGGGGERPGRPA
jgi:hypothetical protein